MRTYLKIRNGLVPKRIFEMVRAVGAPAMPRSQETLAPARSHLVAACQRQRRVAFVPGVPLHFKALRMKDYSQDPQTLGEHLKKRRRELGLLQQEAADRMAICAETYANWEKGKTVPVAAQFQPVVEFLGYDPTPEPQTLAERVEAKQRRLGGSLAQIARHLAWDPGSLRRYLDGTWRISPDRRDALEAFLNAEDTVLGGLLSLKRRR